MESNQASEQIMLTETIIDTENASITDYPDLGETHKDQQSLIPGPA